MYFFFSRSIFILIIFANSVLASDLEFSGKSNTRARTYSDKEQVQQRITLQLKAQITGGWEIIGIAQNGSKFKKGYDNLYESTQLDKFGEAKNVVSNLSIRKLYFQKEFKNKLIQIGSLAPDSGLREMTALHGNGWIDGVRAQIETEQFGKLSVTAGSIGNIEDTKFYERDFDLDYLEIKIEKEVFEKLLIEVGYEKYKDANFLEMASNYQIELASEKVITIISEILYDTDNGKIKASIGAKIELDELFGKDIGGFRVQFKHTYMSSDFHDRGVTLTPGYSGEGAYDSYFIKKELRLKSQNPFSEFLKDTSVYFRVQHYYIPNENYFELGIEKKF